MYLATKPPLRCDQRRAALVIGRDDRAHVLGIEPRGKRGRADEIAEHHGELAALGGVWAGGSTRVPCATAVSSADLARKLRNGRQQLPSMSDGTHAEFHQVVSRQVGQDLAVDLIVTERRLVLAEPKAPQPAPHVHGRVSRWPRRHDAGRV